MPLRDIAHISEITIAPNLPERLRPLHDIALNLWYSWNWEAVDLFLKLDPVEWESCHQNPIALLERLHTSRLEEMAQDDQYIAQVDKVYAHLESYLSEARWFTQEYPEHKDACIAYFCCEYGIDEGLPIYSGGLGVLAGDHLKTASDLGIPLVGVGLLYRQGYFQQELNHDGWQEERYPENDWHSMPVSMLRREDGSPRRIEVNIGGHNVQVQLWLVRVGRIPLYLLDTNVPENRPEDREITVQLYGGDRDMRLRQELLLGIGGRRALEDLQLEPTVYHCNEGHSAFLVLERLRRLKDQGLTLEEAKEVVWASTVFTTHTPVPAGNERFDVKLLESYLRSDVEALGWKWDVFVGLGREDPMDAEEHFCMTVFALRFAAFCNAVSKLHGDVSRNMWRELWPKLHEKELPITHVTNGVHTASWLSHDLAALCREYLGPRFAEDPSLIDVWSRIERIPPDELWRIHEQRRERLVYFTRKLLRQQRHRTGEGAAAVQRVDQILDPKALTVGFARRFATYKRGTLLFSDMDRLRRMIEDEDRPVQFLFAGKAHPHDTGGKQLIQQIVHESRQDVYASKLVFLENYDINIARYLVQGCDVWLNTPRRPLEASGTSGMKAAANGVLNCSVLDGWWCEGYRPELGWSIGDGQEYISENEADRIESRALYDLLEQEIIPMFHRRDRNGLPREWIERMRETMRVLGPQFSAHRMLMEYTTNMYAPAHEAQQRLTDQDCRQARELAAWTNDLAKRWGEASIGAVSLQAAHEGDARRGDRCKTSVQVHLGSLSTDDVTVEVFFGRLSPEGEFVDPDIIPAQLLSEQDGTAIYETECLCEYSGRYGLTARVRGSHPGVTQPHHSELMTWQQL